MKNQAEYDVVIIGGGVAGLSAALYTVRSNLKTLLVEKFASGGQILNASEIENYPGFPDGISGPDLSQCLEKQVCKYGCNFKFDQVEKLEIDGDLRIAHGTERDYVAKTVIIASGGEHKKLGVPGEEEFAGRGVSYCATCDGNFFAKQDVVVVGGGDSALDEGLYLARIVNKVTVVHRRSELRASKVLQDRAFSNPKMQFVWNREVQEIKGNGHGVEKVVLKDVNGTKTEEIAASGVFVYIGFYPVTDYLKEIVETDNGGHIVTNIRMETSVPGIFACGDVRQYSDRQLGTAVGDGITAALSAYRYISDASNP